MTSILFDGERDVFELKQLVVSSWALGCVLVALSVLVCFTNLGEMGENQNFTNAELADHAFCLRFVKWELP